MTAIVGAFRPGFPLEPGIRAALAQPALTTARPSAWGGPGVALACGSRPQAMLLRDAAGRVGAIDCRLDNAAELRAALGHPGVPDAALVLAAYGRWGDDCAGRLLGDFAFAIWDPTRNTLFCARDPMGVRPFYYFATAGFFSFASNLPTLLRVPGVTAEPDEERIAQFVLNVDPGRERTFYRNVQRLPAGHHAVVTPAGITSTRYWRPETSREIRFASPDDYAAAFREIFADAVRVRMGAETPVAAALSGGLDSSSIVCTARSLAGGDPARVHSISLVFPGLPPDQLRRIDERRFISAVTRPGGITTHFVRGDRTSPLHDVDRIVGVLGEPFAAPNLYLHRAMFGAAADAGAAVFLDGFDGDSAVGHGLARLDALLARGDIETYDREVRSFARHRGIHPAAVARSFGLPRLAGLAFAGRWLQWTREAAHHHRAYAFSRRDLAVDYGLRPSRLGRLVRGGRAERTAPVPSPREAHLAGLMQPAYQGTLEIAAHCAASFGVDARYPFFDRRLIEFCVAIPDEQKFASGWTRLVMRNAMRGVLPEEIRLRPDKGNLLPAFHRGFRSDDAARINAVDLRLLEPFVDVDAVVRLRSEYAAAPDPEREDLDPFLLFRLAALDSWLKHRQGGPTAEALPREPVAMAVAV